MWDELCISPCIKNMIWSPWEILLQDTQACVTSRASNIAFLLDWAQTSDLDFGLIQQNISIKKASFQYQRCPLSFKSGKLWLNSYIFIIRTSYELRRCVRARTRAMCGRTCACACEIHSGKCAGCACVRPFLGRAMCDHTFAHFLGQKYQKMLRFRTSFPALEHPFLFWIILFCFRTH